MNNIPTQWTWLPGKVSEMVSERDNSYLELKQLRKRVEATREEING